MTKLDLPPNWVKAPMNRYNVFEMGMPQSWSAIFPPLSPEAILCIRNAPYDSMVEFLALGTSERIRQSGRGLVNLLADLLIETVPEAEEYKNVRIMSQSDADLPNGVRLRQAKFG